MQIYRLETQWGPLAYADSGHGEPLLYVHGLGASGTEDFPVLFRYLPGYRHIAPDLYGFGRSARCPCEAYEFDNQARALAALADALGLSRINIVGHSMGGTVAQAFYRLFPARVKTLILAEANYRTGGGAISRKIAGFGSLAEFQLAYPMWMRRFEPKPGARPGDIQYARSLSLADPRALYVSARQLVERLPFPDGFIRQIAVPLIWVTGELSWDKETAGIMREWGIETACVPGAGHAMAIDQPACFAAIVANFLGSHELGLGSEEAKNF